MYNGQSDPYCIYLFGKNPPEYKSFHLHLLSSLEQLFDSLRPSQHFFSYVGTDIPGLNIIRVANSLEPDQANHFFGPDVVLNCFQSCFFCLI